MNASKQGEVQFRFPPAMETRSLSCLHPRGLCRHGWSDVQRNGVNRAWHGTTVHLRSNLPYLALLCTSHYSIILRCLSCHVLFFFFFTDCCCLSLCFTYYGSLILCSSPHKTHIARTGLCAKTIRSFIRNETGSLCGHVRPSGSGRSTQGF